MENSELFQKYLDNELADHEKSAVVDLLKTDHEAKSLFQSMKTNREKIVGQLDLLNPAEIETPSKFRQPTNSRKVFWRIAATIIILFGISTVLWLSNRNSEDIIEEKVIAEEISEEIFSNELDYYISPNRCWKNRELVWTLIETK